jgi:hypothetical protein
MIVNLCPHPITVHCSGVSIPVSGLARVATSSSQTGTLRGPPDARGYVDVLPVYEIAYGDVTGLPEPVEGTTYVVSLVVLQACPERRDLVAPGTGPQDGAIRDADGKIVAVTRFVRLARSR